MQATHAPSVPLLRLPLHLSHELPSATHSTAPTLRSGSHAQPRIAIELLPSSGPSPEPRHRHSPLPIAVPSGGCHARPPAYPTTLAAQVPSNGARLPLLTS